MEPRHNRIPRPHRTSRVTFAASLAAFVAAAALGVVAFAYQLVSWA